MATSAELLAEARTAYHRLTTGQAVVEVRDSSGESVRYTQANGSRLRAYIRELEAEIAGTAATVQRPLRPVWG